MKIYLAIWPTNDQLKTMREIKAKRILQSFYFIIGRTKDYGMSFRHIFDNKE